MAAETFLTYLGVGTHRRFADYYPTPPVATYALYKVERGHAPFPESVLEPAAGRGHIAHELRRLGVRVVARDLFAHPDPLIDDIAVGVDFVAAPESDCVGVVTNPPFKDDLPIRFVRTALERYRYVAVFCRLSFLDGRGRHDLFRERPMSRVWTLSDRVHCDDDRIAHDDFIGGMVPYAWFVWDYRFGPPRETVLGHIDVRVAADLWKAETNASLTDFFEREAPTCVK